MEKNRTYIAIDLKSFYASIECVERNLDPLITNLVVADRSRTSKTICLAVSPSLKAYGIGGRPRLFEVEQKVKQINDKRRNKAYRQRFKGKSYDANALAKDHDLELDYVVATPRMALYISYSTKIYNIYLKYIASEDIHVYSIDEVFMDVTDYLHTYNMSAHDLAMMIIKDVLKETRITATAGIGTNLYLCKVAMDIVAKHVDADKDGVRIASLDMMSYRQKLWEHRPLTSFWRVGKGYAKKLEENGLYTMGDVARCSIDNEELLYKLFGVNAQLLIDHAWGYEPCTIADIKAYKPDSKSYGISQVLHCTYNFKQTRLVVQEMADMLALNLVEKQKMCKQIVLNIEYDIENINDGKYHGEVTIDRYGRKLPKHAHGTIELDKYNASSKLICEACDKLYTRIIDASLLTRKISISAIKIIDEDEAKHKNAFLHQQLDLFSNNDDINDDELEKEHAILKTMVNIKKKYGKNAILKGMNLLEDATAKDQNEKIGGHKA